jgi:hypothetical protein
MGYHDTLDYDEYCRLDGQITRAQFDAELAAQRILAERDTGIDRVSATFGHVPVGLTKQPGWEAMISVDVVPHAEQDYDTPAAWEEVVPVEWMVEVSDLGDWRYNLLTALGQQIELALCKQAGVTSEQIQAFAVAHGKRRRAGDSDYQGAPGDHPDAPHKKAYRFAQQMLKQIAPELGIVWSRYQRALEAL